MFELGTCKDNVSSFSEFSIYIPSEHKLRGRDQRAGSKSGETPSREDEKKRREARSWTQWGGFLDKVLILGSLKIDGGILFEPSGVAYCLNILGCLNNNSWMFYF